MNIYKFPREEVEKVIRGLGFKKQLESSINFEVRDSSPICELKIREALGYNLPSIFDEIVNNEVKGKIRAGEMDPEEVISHLEKRIEDKAKILEEMLNSAKDCIKLELQRIISRGMVMEARIRAQSTINLLNEYKNEPKPEDGDLETIRNESRTQYKKLKEALDEWFGWRKAERIASMILDLLETYEQVYRKKKEFKLKLRFIEECIDFLKNLIMILERFIKEVKERLKEIVQTINDPNVKIPSVDDLVVDDLYVIPDLNEYEKKWFERVKDLIKEKVKQSFTPDLSPMKLNLDRESERWRTPKGFKAKDKIRVYIAIAPDFIPRNRIKGLEHFDYLVRKPGWKIVVYKFVFNIRVAEFIEYLKEVR